MGLVDERRRSRPLRRQAALRRCRRPDRRRWHRARRLCLAHRRDGAPLDLPEDQLTTSPSAIPTASTGSGPLARLNVVDRCGTPRAGQEWAEFRELDRGAVLSSFYYHYARLIEILYAIEQMEQLLTEPDILDTHVRAHARRNNSRRHRRCRGAARHADPPLQGGRATA